MPIAVFDLGTTQGTLTIPAGGVPAGSLIVLAIADYAGTSETFADTAGNVYVRAGSETNAGNTQISVWYAYDCLALASGNTITVAGPGSYSLSALYATGIQTASDPRDTAAQGSASGDSATPSCTLGAAPAAAGSLVVGAVALADTYNGTYTQPTGWTTPLDSEIYGGSYNIAGGHETTSTQDTYAPTLASAVHWSALLAVFKPASGATPLALLARGAGMTGARGAAGAAAAIQARSGCHGAARDILAEAAALAAHSASRSTAAPGATFPAPLAGRSAGRGIASALAAGPARLAALARSRGTGSGALAGAAALAARAAAQNQGRGPLASGTQLAVLGRAAGASTGRAQAGFAAPLSATAVGHAAAAGGIAGTAALMARAAAASRALGNLATGPIVALVARALGLSAGRGAAKAAAPLAAEAAGRARGTGAAVGSAALAGRATGTGAARGNINLGTIALAARAALTGAARASAGFAAGIGSRASTQTAMRAAPSAQTALSARGIAASAASAAVWGTPQILALAARGLVWLWGRSSAPTLLPPAPENPAFGLNPELEIVSTAAAPQGAINVLTLIATNTGPKRG